MSSPALDMSLDEIIKNNNGRVHDDLNGGRGRGRGTVHRGGGVSRGYGRSKPSEGQIVWRPTRKTGSDTPSPETTPKASTPAPPVQTLPANTRKTVHPLAELFVKSIKLPPNEGDRNVVSSPARPPSRGVTPRQQHVKYDHDKFDDGVNALGKATGIETGTKLYVSNLDYGISNEDIKELFSEVGELKRCSINYDRIGRSKGTAEVVYTKKADAIAAIKRYNNVQLDGKPMKIEAIGGSLIEDRPARPGGTNMTYKGGFGLYISPRRAPAAFGHRQVIRGRGGRSAGRGGSTMRKTAEDLDADLENYHADTN